MTLSKLSNLGSSLTRRATAPAPWVDSPGVFTGYLAMSVEQTMLDLPLARPAHAQSNELSSASSVLTQANLYSTPEVFLNAPLPYFCSSIPCTYAATGFDSSTPVSVAMSILAMFAGERLFRSISSKIAFAAKTELSWYVSGIDIFAIPIPCRYFAGSDSLARENLVGFFCCSSLANSRYNRV